MEVRLLGEVAVAADATDGAPVVRIDAPRQRLCLAVLALWPGAASVDALADVVWAGEPPANWKAALRNAVAKLRRDVESFGGPSSLITTTPAGYRLGSGHTVDVQVAVAAVDAADEALAAGDADRALALATSAADRLESELVAGLDVEWLIPHRTRAHAAGIRARQLAAVAARTLGRPADAIGHASRAVSADPLREESHRQLMAALLRAGDRAGSLRAYEECRRTLADELGISPDEQTVAIYLDALGTEPALPAPRVVAASSPFVGRVREVAELDAALTLGSVVVLSGPGGIGKSRLATEFVRRHADRFDGGRFTVDLELLDDGSVLAAVAAAIGAGPIAVDAGLDVVVAALAPRGPSLLVLDGVDRGLDAAAALIAELTAACPNVSVLATARAPIGTPGEHALRLRGLDPASDAAACFTVHADAAGAILDDGPDATAAVAELCRAVDGNPLAIALLAGQAASMSLPDLLDRVGARDELGDDVPPGRPPIGSSPLSTVIASSVDQLDDAERQVFARLGVIAGRADLQLVQAVVADATVAPGRVVRILSQLVERGLVVLDRDTRRWRYELHPVLRETANEMLGAAGRRDGYRRLAAALFGRLPATPTAVPTVTATRHVLPATRGLLAAALTGDADADDALRLAFWLHRYWAADGVDEGARWLRRLLEAAGPDADGRGLAAFGLGYLLVWAGRPDDAARWLTEATALLDTSDDPIHAMAHYFLAGTYENRQPDLACRHFASAAEAATAAGNTDLATICTEGLGVVEFEDGRMERGLARVEAAMRARHAFGGDASVAAALPQYAHMLVSAGRLDDAETALRRADDLLGDEVRIATVVAAATRARVDRLRGRLPAARRHAERAVTMVEASGMRRLDPVSRTTLALVDLAEGETAAALDGLTRAIKSASETAQPPYLADALDAATLVALALGRVEPADVINGAADAVRARAHVVRGRLEQRELDTALGPASRPGRDDRRRDGASVELVALGDLVGALAADTVGARAH